MALNFDYAPSRAYAESIGLTWLGDDYAGLVNADREAAELGMTQTQVDGCMRHHLWQMKWVMTPSNYSLSDRIKLAVHFLSGG